MIESRLLANRFVNSFFLATTQSTFVARKWWHENNCQYSSAEFKMGNLESKHVYRTTLLRQWSPLGDGVDLSKAIGGSILFINLFGPLEFGWYGTDESYCAWECQSQVVREVADA